MACFVVAQLVFFTAYSLFAVPYAALTYEMTPDYHERTRVMAYVGFFHKIGEMLGGWMPALLGAATALVVAGATDIRIEGVHAMAWIVGLFVFAGLGSVPALCVRERFGRPVTGGAPVSLIPAVKSMAGSRATVILLAIVSLNTMSGVVGSSIDQFVLVYYMWDGDAGAGLVQKAVLGTGYTAVGIAAIPLITWIAGRLGKAGALYFVYGLMVAGSLAKWFVFRPGNPVVPLLGIPIDIVMLIDPLLCGPMWVSVKVVLPSMIADVCDEDELRHGQRREAVIGSVISSFEKITMSVAALVAGGVLTLAGFEADLGGEQAGRTFTTLRLCLVAVPGGAAVAVLALVRLYPLSAARMGRIRRAVERRRGRTSGNPAPAGSG
jgi:GPH family glycoside/pentoside/hexuronide:cation symporter